MSHPDPTKTYIDDEKICSCGCPESMHIDGIEHCVSCVDCREFEEQECPSCASKVGRKCLSCSLKEKSEGVNPSAFAVVVARPLPPGSGDPVPIRTTIHFFVVVSKKYFTCSVLYCRITIINIHLLPPPTPQDFKQVLP